MRRYVETFFRHRVLLIAPLVIALVAGLGYAKKQPKKFVAWGTLWADAPIPNDSTVVSGGTDSGPAAQQQSVLKELLQTKDFLAKVGKRSPYASFLATHPETANDAVLAKIARSIAVSTLGPQVLSVSVSGTSPSAVAGTTTAVIDEYMSEMVATRKVRSQELADYYKQQADATGKAIGTSQTQLTEYLRSHPGSANDPTAIQLAGSVGVAQQQYSQALDNYTKASLGLSHVSDSSQLRIIDKPVVPIAPASRKKKIIFAGVGALVAGAVISLMVMMFLVASDTAARHEEDIEDALGLQVVGAVKQFPGRRGRSRKVS